MASKSLRQRVIARIRREGIDMRWWTPAESSDMQDCLPSPHKRSCGTPCCMAGNIGLELGLLTGDSPSYSVDESRVRAEWAKVYGKEEAERLNFFFRVPGKCLKTTTPEEVIAHLMAIRSRTGSSRKKDNRNGAR